MLIPAVLRDRIAIRRSRKQLESGDVRLAIDSLTTANRRKSSPRLEEELVRTRYEGFFRSSYTSRFQTWPPSPTDTFTNHDGIPEIDKDDVSASVIRDGVLTRGSIIVRGLLSNVEVECLRATIDKAYQQHDRAMSGAARETTTPWFAPFVPSSAHNDHDFDRQWFRETGAELAADSPRGMFELLEIFTANGIDTLAGEYLGEPPALSVKKTSLRRVPHDQPSEHGWHQDGAFLGQGIRTMNLWIALSDCGVDAPSMDMVPRRLNYIVPTGTEGAIFDWSVSSRQITEACDGGEPTHLHFKAGDAIVFDEMNLHRTSALPGMTKPRYAIEAWFFAPSCYPLDQLPLLV